MVSTKELGRESVNSIGNHKAEKCSDVYASVKKPSAATADHGRNEVRKLKVEG